MEQLARRAYLPWLFLSVALLAYLGVMLHSGRLFVFDDIFYKSAGFHWATEGRFASPELTGRLQSNPSLEKIFACYPPGYPFAFGVYMRVVGFGWRQVMFFDALIHAGLCVTLALATRRLLRVFAIRRDWIAATIGVLTIPLGTLGRPDELAMIFGLWATIVLIKPARPLISGALLGLCAATSLVPAMSFLLIAAGWMLFSNRPARDTWVRLLSLGAMAGLFFVICVAPVFIAEPRALSQFLAHAALAIEPGSSRFGAWRWAIGFDPYTIFLNAAVLTGACVMIISGARYRAIRTRLQSFGGAILAIVGILLVSDGKYFYLWYPGAWLLSATIALAAQRPRAWSSRLALGLIGIGIMVGSLRFMRERVLIASFPEAQRFPLAGAQVAAMVPPGSRVLANDHWATLAATCEVYDARFAGADVLDRLDYVVLASNFGGQTRHPEPLRNDLAPYIAEHFRLIASNPSDRFYHLFGVPITRGVYGFGADVLKRIDTRPR